MLLVIFGSLFLMQATDALSAPRPVFNSVAETRFQRALDRYNHKDFAPAKVEFQSLLDLSPTHQRSSASALMLAKTKYKLQTYDDAMAEVARLYERFPGSRYLPEGDLVIGDCRFRKGEMVLAVEKFVQVIKGSGDLGLKARAADRLVQMVETGRLGTEEVNRLKRILPPLDYQEVMQFGRIRCASRLGRTEQVSSEARAFLTEFPHSPYLGQVVNTMRAIPTQPSASETVRPRPEVGGSGRPKLGVICPKDWAEGKELRDGIQLGRDTLTPAVGGGSVELIFEDSGDDPIVAIKKVQKLAQDRDLLAIIGDLTSYSTVPAAGAANAYGIPLIAPTASEDGIASIGNCIFQINATPGMQGRRIAELAIRGGIKTFAVLASRDTYGSHMHDAFAARVEELGGHVLVHEWYIPGTSDFRNQISQIRKVGESLMDPEPRPVIQAPDTALAWGDTVGVVRTIGGFLVAAQSPEDVILIISQIVFQRIDTRLLGGDGWNSPRVAREIGDVVRDALFVSKYFEDPGYDVGRRFREAFRGRFGRDPTVAAALGYDAITCVLKAFEAGGATREKLRERLSAGQDFYGATGRVLLNAGERENRGLYTLTFEGGKIVSELLPEGAGDQ